VWHDENRRKKKKQKKVENCSNPSEERLVKSSSSY